MTTGSWSARLLLSLLLLTAAGTATKAQTPSPADAAARADAFFQNSDWQNAAGAYSALVGTDVSNGNAWFRLGIASHSLGKLDDAKRAFLRAIDLNASPQQARMRIARIHAMTGQPDSALAILDGMVKTGFMQSAAITNQPDFAAMRSDARLTDIIAKMDANRFPCRTRPESRQFDFWEGSWNVSIGGQKVGTNNVVSMLASCVLQENWTDMQGGEGKSINYFDPNTGKWRQVWVADNGGVLDYTGAFADGAMRFSGVTLDAKGNRTLQKLTFFPIARDSVRQLFETSTDEGRTWTPGFDGMYVRQQPAKPKDD